MKEYMKSYCILLQYLTEMSNTFISNAVATKIELCNCLWRRRKVVFVFEKNAGIYGKLLHYIAMVDLDIQHLHLQCYYTQDRVV